MKAKVVTLIGAVALLAACSESTAPGGDAAQVSLSFTTRAASSPSLSISGLSAGGSLTLLDGPNELVITKAEVVLREIELKRVEVVDCDVEPEPAGCEEFKAGPVLLDLPLDGSTSQLVTVAIEPGSYDEIEFDIHKVSSGDAEDAAFRQAHPDLVDLSIRVQGTFNGQAFTYETDLNEDQEFDLVPPLVIDETTTSTNVTVRLDLSQWFRDGAGALLDPASANKGESNENLVKDNIRDSIKAFEDRDKDGDELDEG